MTKQNAILTYPVASEFVDLTDCPTTYVGQTGKTLRVNSGETGLEFATVTGDFTELYVTDAHIAITEAVSSMMEYCYLTYESGNNIDDPGTLSIQTGTGISNYRNRLWCHSVIFGDPTEDEVLGRVYDNDVDGYVIAIDEHKIWHAGNDGSGSTLDADTLDGYHAVDFATTGSALPSGTEGDILIYTDGAWTPLGHGDEGQVLMSQGHGLPPIWSDISAV